MLVTSQLSQFAPILSTLLFLLAPSWRLAVTAPPEYHVVVYGYHALSCDRLHALRVWHHALVRLHLKP